MARCEGTTKSGARCKRPAAEGATCCGIHADQERRAPEPDPAPGKHPLADAAAIGIIALGMLALRRLIRWR